MAAYQAGLHVDNGMFMVNRVNFFAIRDRDSKGRPVSKSAWTLMVSLYAVRDAGFTEWMLDSTKAKDITIEFFEGPDSKKKWQFSKTYCVGFEENFIDDLGIYETIIILSGQEASNGNATITYNWET